MKELIFYKSALEDALEAHQWPSNPDQLYRPIAYILGIGGKRLRPVLTLMTCACFGGDHKKAMPAALAVELFHNFSLIHDDIMDQAPLRRGQVTVHHKWDLNTGILSGDALLILAYQHFESYAPQVFMELAQLFSKTALEVCEGQQYDMDFESRDEVAVTQYLKMIEYKTAVLVGAAMKMGAIVAGAPSDAQQRIYDFGLSLGMAFQLQDDYLDAFGDPETFGKQVGGDIISGKKTYLYLSALAAASVEQRSALLKLYQNQNLEDATKVSQALDLFQATGAPAKIQTAIQDYTMEAFRQLDAIDMDQRHKEQLRDFGTALMDRKV